MKTHSRTIGLVILFGAIILMACASGRSINYGLGNEPQFEEESSLPHKVAIAILTDKREASEKERQIRENNGGEDLGDYTYDAEFKDPVALGVTKMAKKHIDNSLLFQTKIEQLELESEKLDDAALDSLNQAGFQYIIAGDLNHFYGYYDSKLGRSMLYALPLAFASGSLLNFSTTSGGGMIETKTTYYWYGPGLVAGYYLESLHKRNMERATAIQFRMIDTQTKQILWDEEIAVNEKTYKSRPGLSSGKYTLVMESLKEIMQKAVTSLSAVLLNQEER